MSTTPELPPLPSTDYSLCFYDEGGMQEAAGDGFTAEHMHAYARTAIAPLHAECEALREALKNVLPLAEDAFVRPHLVWQILDARAALTKHGGN